MAGPLNGIGGQIPFANTYQPGQSAQLRTQQDERTPKPNDVQPRGTQAAQTNEPETRNSRDLQSLLREVQASGETGRVSVVDITV